MTTTEQRTLGLIQLAADLWPRWTITESIADLMLYEFSELDPDCAQKAIREHRLSRSTVPDLGEMVKAAKALSESKATLAAHRMHVQAFTPGQGDIRVARGRLSEMDDERRLWLWRYCRNMAMHSVSWVTIQTWPVHWGKTAPQIVDWPDEVLSAYHSVHAKLGI